jgi:acetyl-CoA acyltransferase
MREAVIVSSVRTAVGKAPKGALRTTRPDDLAATAIKEAIARAKGLDPAEIDDVVIGCATPEAEQGMNVARIASLRAGLPVTTSAMTINRFCSSGLQAIANAAQSIMAGHSEVAIGGGTESMSMIPMGGNKVAINPWLADNYPDTYLNMGLTAENLAKEVRRHAGRGGCVCFGESSESDCGDCGGKIQRRNRARRGELRVFRKWRERCDCAEAEDGEVDL